MLMESAQKNYVGHNQRNCIEIPYKIQSSTVSIEVPHGDHNFFVSASSIVTDRSDFKCIIADDN